MKSEKENEKVNTDEMGVAIGVDNEVIHKVRSGEITHIIVDINEDNQNMFLENIDGNLVLVTEEMPDTFHGCYFYNGGEFPYAIKGVLEFLDLSSDDVRAQASPSWKILTATAACGRLVSRWYLYWQSQGLT